MQSLKLCHSTQTHVFTILTCCSCSDISVWQSHCLRSYSVYFLDIPLVIDTIWQEKKKVGNWILYYSDIITVQYTFVPLSEIYHTRNCGLWVSDHIHISAIILYITWLFRASQWPLLYNLTHAKLLLWLHHLLNSQCYLTYYDIALLDIQPQVSVWREVES